MKLSEEGLVKRYRTDIKSAQGVIAMATVLGIIYVLVGLISKNWGFYFGISAVKFCAVNAVRAQTEPEQTLKMWLFAALAAVCVVLYIVAVLLARKNPKKLWFGLVLYGADSVFLAFIDAARCLEPFKKEDIIDLVFHAFIMVFLVVGVRSVKRLEKKGIKPEPI